jgi:hypothetical protein
MWTGRFDTREGIIWVTARVYGPLGDRILSCILDTGSPQTILDSAILDSLGYSAQMGTRAVTLSGIGGRLPGYELRIMRFDTMGVELLSFPVLSQDIVPSNLGVEGLIGMDLIVGRALSIDGVTGTISLST